MKYFLFLLHLVFLRALRSPDISTVKLSTGYNDELGDFYSEIRDPALEHSQPLALPQSMF